MHELRTLSDEELSRLTTGQLIVLASEYHLVDSGYLASGDLHVELGMHELSFEEEEEGREVLIRLLQGARAILAEAKE